MDISLGVVGHLVLLVDEGILGSFSTGAQLGVIVLSDVLVGLLGSLGTSALDGLSDVVGGVLINGLVCNQVEQIGAVRTLTVSIVKFGSEVWKTWCRSSSSCDECRR